MCCLLRLLSHCLKSIKPLNWIMLLLLNMKVTELMFLTNITLPHIPEKKCRVLKWLKTVVCYLQLMIQNYLGLSVAFNTMKSSIFENNCLFSWFSITTIQSGYETVNSTTAVLTVRAIKLCSAFQVNICSEEQCWKNYFFLFFLLYDLFFWIC